ncbi:MAG: MraY family glycosyltransferase [Pseudomonadota bacterium]
MQGQDLFSGFFVALLVSMLLVPPLIRLAGRLKLVDEPDSRKIHEENIPRTGGIAIVLGALVPLSIWLSFDRQTSFVLAGAAIIVIFGLLDDRNNLNYKWKFFGQILAVAVAMYGGLMIRYLPFFGIDPVPMYVSIPVTTLFLLGVTNAINLSDGLDGLAAGASLITLSAIAWLAYRAGGPQLALLALSVMGGICGFLRYNNYPAVVFMGDTGSQFLGFLTASFAVLLTQDLNIALNPALLLLLLGLPILDTLVVMVWRMRNGRSPFLPDKSHFHHRLLEIGFLHYQAVSMIYLAQAALVATAIFVRYQSDVIVLSVYVVFSAIVIGFFRWSRVSEFDPGAGEAGREYERRNTWLRRVTWLPDVSTRGVALLIGALLVAAALYPANVPSSFGAMSGVISLLLALSLLMPLEWRRTAMRVGVYLASVCAVYSLSMPAAVHHLPAWFLNGWLVLIGLFIIVAIRVTRRTEFRTTPLDLLILFFVIVVVTSSVYDEVLAQYDAGSAAIRLALLFYGGEFLYNKGRGYYTPLPVAAFLATAVLAARGLLIG